MLALNFRVGIHKYFLKSFYCISSVATLLLMSSCSDFKINAKPESSVDLSSLSSFCTLPPKAIGQFTKVMFVVDQSGSNAGGVGPTDPTKARRRDAITNFYKAHSNNKYIQWGFISFQSDAATAFITDPYYQAASSFPAALAKFETTTDQGATPYKAAIFEVNKAITSDLQLAKNDDEANYEVIFMSDGNPTDYGQPPNDGSIYQDITNLVKLAEGRIHFSTVYYNVSSGADAQASGRLKEMANVGFGKFLDASNGEDINIDELIIGGVDNVSYHIKDLFVYNLNSTLCDDGDIGADSDADGLCDRDEDRYNTKYKDVINANPAYANKLFDKYKRNSFSSLYSDLFILRNLQGEMLPPCTAAEATEDADADLLNTCEEKFLVNRNPQGPTQDWTNELRAGPKYANKNNFDSDGDGLMDSLEFFFFKEKAASLDFNSVNRKLYGITYYDLFKNHQSKINPGSSLPYNMTLHEIERNDKGQNCYTFSQQNLPMYPVGSQVFSQTNNLDLVHKSDENIILVYYIMTPENDPEGKGVMRYSYQKIKLSQGAKQIDLSTDRFDYIYAK